jgi:hypothetical protein
VLLALAACGETPEPNAPSGGAHDAGEDASAPPPVDSGTHEADAGSMGAEDAGSDSPDPALCPPERIVPSGCEDLGGLDEGNANRCDGFDNDCNGLVDENCPCVDGSVQECFAGPPGRVDTGACQRGIQVCDNSGEFGGWGSCRQDIAPSAEVCDRLDNDCNGCVDEREDCDVFIECPGEGDRRIPPAKPFEDYALDATQFYNGNDVASIKWTVQGSPCDELWASIPGSNANSTNGRLSYVFRKTAEHDPKKSLDSQAKATVRFTLSGTYLVTLTIVRKSGQELSCTFPVIVGAAGLRVELCWDKTGPTAGEDFVDLDLHLALKGQTTEWFAAQDFYFLNFDIPAGRNGTGLWSHPNTPGAEGCITGIDPSLDSIHEMRRNCLNPRLDIDNRGDTDIKRYLPENINLDNPRKGEVFQIAVNHRTAKAVGTRALVNVYCGGNLRGSFALDPDETPFSDVALASELWRVAEVAPRVNAAGITKDCALAPLHPAGSDDGALVTENDSSMTWSD